MNDIRVPLVCSTVFPYKKAILDLRNPRLFAMSSFRKTKMTYFTHDRLTHARDNMPPFAGIG